MNLRVRAILTVLLAVSAMLATCAAYAVPAYPESKLLMEMTLTDQDFLPAIKAFIPAMPGIISAVAKSEGEMPEGMESLFSPEIGQDVSKAVSGLKSVSTSVFEMKSADEEKLLEFYIQKFGLTKGWSQTLKGGDARGFIALYVKPGLEETFGLVVYPQGYIVSRTIGPVDVALLAKTFAKMIPAAITIAQQHRTQPVSTEVSGGVTGSDEALGITWEMRGPGKVIIEAPDGSQTSEATSLATDTSATPKLTVTTKTGVIEKEGYGTYEIPGEDGKTVMIIVVEPLPKPAE